MVIAGTDEFLLSRVPVRLPCRFPPHADVRAQCGHPAGVTGERTAVGEQVAAARNVTPGR